MNKKKILFLTGTRADFGKLKSLINILNNDDGFEVNIFATGMHLSKKYGYTIDEIYKSGFKNIFPYMNHDSSESMDKALAKTIEGLSKYFYENEPDMIVVHGDRVEALAGAIVGSLNNVLVSHIEGGEISGTIDETIRHAVSKMSHIHFVSNEQAKLRILQLGEKADSIFKIGSPDLDLMNPDSLPKLSEVMDNYNLHFKKFSLAMFHPITTEYNNISKYASDFIDALIKSNKNYILIYPNNDLGSELILEQFKKCEGNEKIRIFPSLRFEYFLRLLESCDFIIGNSSAGVREAPYYDTPTVDIGTRQLNRAKGPMIINCSYGVTNIISAIEQVSVLEKDKINKGNCNFGDGNSDELFLDILKQENVWEISIQKSFQDLN